jgi:hypothetical protein
LAWRTASRTRRARRSLLTFAVAGAIRNRIAPFDFWLRPAKLRQQQVNAGRAARDREATTKRYEGRALDAGLRLSAILEAMTISSC